jgi:hypothetical protein
LVKETPLSNSNPGQLKKWLLKTSKNNSRDQKTKDGYENKLIELAKGFGDNSPAYKAVSYRKGQFFQNLSLVTYLKKTFTKCWTTYRYSRF